MMSNSISWRGLINVRYVAMNCAIKLVSGNFSCVKRSTSFSTVPPMICGTPARAAATRIFFSESYT